MIRLKIEHDQDAQDPRRDYGEHADVMYCKHSRYDLGDKDAEDPMTEVSFVTLTSEAGTSYVLDDSDSTDDTNLIMDDVLEMLETHANEAADDAAEGTQSIADWERTQSGFEWLRAAKWQSERRERPGIALCRPLFLYDHSGITIRAGQFSCPWDSGQVGWQYVTAEALKTEWDGDEAKATAYMDATLKEYDDYLTGECYGFIIEACMPFQKTYPSGHIEDGFEWADVESCWGFIGDWRDKDSGIRDSLSDNARELLDAMSWTDVGEWQYSADVPEDARCD